MTAISYGSSDTPTSKEYTFNQLTWQYIFHTESYSTISASLKAIFFTLDDVELWIVMTSIVSGALMYTVMVANTAALMSDVDITSRAYKNKVKKI